jgi:predicted nucleic acid-binding protein
MNVFLLDASALVKRYAVEKGSPLMHHLFGQAAPTRLSCLMLGAAEVFASLVRRRNDGRLSLPHFTLASGAFLSEVLKAHNFTKHPAANPLIERAIGLLPTHPINANDAVVLQTTLDLAGSYRPQGDDLILVASDQRLLKAAQAEGLVTFDPETQPQSDLDKLL